MGQNLEIKFVELLMGSVVIRIKEYIAVKDFYKSNAYK